MKGRPNGRRGKRAGGYDDSEWGRRGAQDGGEGGGVQDDGEGKGCTGYRMMERRRCGQNDGEEEKMCTLSMACAQYCRCHPQDVTEYLEGRKEGRKGRGKEGRKEGRKGEG